MARRRSRSTGSRRGGVGLFLLGLLVGAGVLYLVFRDRPPGPGDPGTATEESAPSSAGEERESPSSTAERPSPPPSDHVEPEDPTAAPVRTVNAEDAEEGEDSDAPVRGVRIALVIDDLGRTVDDLGPLAELGIPITYAVLPYEEQTPQVVAELRRRRAEVLLHLPMEPKNGQDPGPGALRLGMEEGELRDLTLDALRAVPGIVGVNNHMGSGLTEDQGSMDAILGVLAARGLFFLDSRTSAQSVGYRTAIRLGIPSAERQVFLDGDPSPEAIEAQFQRLLDVARTRGAAVAIGHPHPETLAALAAAVPRAKELGYEFVPVSYLLDRPDDVE
jgi:hypothetical protein